MMLKISSGYFPLIVGGADDNVGVEWTKRCATAYFSECRLARKNRALQTVCGSDRIP